MLLEPFEALAYILKIPATIETYKIIPMGFDL